MSETALFIATGAVVIRGSVFILGYIGSHDDTTILIRSTCLLLGTKIHFTDILAPAK